MWVLSCTAGWALAAGRQALPALEVERPPLLPAGWSTLELRIARSASSASADTSLAGTFRTGLSRHAEAWGIVGGGWRTAHLESGPGWDDVGFGLRLGGAIEPPMRAAWVGFGVFVPSGRMGSASDPSRRSAGAATWVPEIGMAALFGPWRADLRGTAWLAPDRTDGRAEARWRVNVGPLVPILGCGVEGGVGDAAWGLDLGGGLSVDAARGFGVSVVGGGIVAGTARGREVEGKVDLRW